MTARFLFTLIQICRNDRKHGIKRVSVCLFMTYILAFVFFSVCPYLDRSCHLGWGWSHCYKSRNKSQGRWHIAVGSNHSGIHQYLQKRYLGVCTVYPTHTPSCYILDCFVDSETCSEILFWVHFIKMQLMFETRISGNWFTARNPRTLFSQSRATPVSGL